MEPSNGVNFWATGALIAIPCMAWIVFGSWKAFVIAVCAEFILAAAICISDIHREKQGKQ